MRNIYYITVVYLFATACTNSGQPVGNKSVPTDNQDTLTGNWYRHYTGTIAGKAVVLNMYYYNREVRGTYYYADMGLPIEIFNGEDTTPVSSNIYITEKSRTERTDGNDDTQNPHWVVILAGNKLNGKWISRDGKKTYDIDLTESYPEGTYKFDVLMSDSSFGKGVVTAIISDQVSIPGKDMSQEDKDFLDIIVHKEMSGSADSLGTYKKCLSERNSEYLEAVLTEADTTTENDGDSLANHNESINNSWVLYNEHKWIVFESFNYGYMGGVHGDYGSSYICVDMKEKKAWGLKDIMKVDTIKLMQVIEQEARRTFHIQAGKSLSDVMLTDTIPVTDNIYFTEKGIIFNYSPYEIASFADGQVSFFIPFTKIQDMLKPEFKKRMNL